MKITDIFKQQEKTFSFEFFPPKDEISAMEFGIHVGRLMNLSPSFVTVTYGAGGSTQERTFGIVDLLQNKIGLPTMAHYTCVNATREKVTQDIRQLKEIGIQNLMLLRGDPPKGSKVFVPKSEQFQHASDLMAFAKTINDFSIGGAAYVETHPESTDFDTELRHLKTKIDRGADFLVTQMFFVNDCYFAFMDRARRMGIQCRIIPGIIPITNYKQIKRFVALSHATIPRDLARALESAQDNPAEVYKIGVDFATQQIIELLENGAPGIHFYTLNKSRATIDIYETMRESIEV